MAMVTEQGPTTPTLREWLDGLWTRYRNVFGQDLADDPETPTGQWIGVHAAVLAELGEAFVSVANGQSLDAAFGFQLDAHGTRLAIPRLRATRSGVTLTLSGTADTVIAAGSRVNDADGDSWLLAATARIGSGGDVDADFMAEETGPVAAAAGEVTRIVTVVPGWDTVTNAAAAVPGRADEGDTDYRARLRAVPSRNGTAAPSAIAARVASVAGVTKLRVLDNDTAAQVTVESLTIPARSFMVVVEGGDDDDVAEAIALGKTIGIPTAGAASGVHGNRTIAFQRVTSKALVVTLTIDAGAGFPSNGVSLIEDALIAWVDGLGIGGVLDLGRIYEALNSVPGYVVSSLDVRQNPGSPETLVQAIGDEVYALDRGDITINVN